MNKKAEILFHETLSLSFNERALLARKLITSLETDIAEHSDLDWIQLSEQDSHHKKVIS